MSFFKGSPATFLLSGLLSGVLLALPGAPAAQRTAGGLPFIEDDYSRAVAAAKARHVPIFVEAWAPW